ncbi:hypothetical protein PMAYCL1PPCAC_30231, partial [Pristionchus mayeri]
GSSFSSSYLPSAYQPPTNLYRPLQQPAYNTYALPQPLPPPHAPPLNSQLPPQIAVEPAAIPSSYVSQHPTLLQQSVSYPTSLPAHPPDFDSSASLIQYSTLKRGEGRSLRGTNRPPPFSPEKEEDFQLFEQSPVEKKENDFNLQTREGEEELYDDAV